MILLLSLTGRIGFTAGVTGVGNAMTIDYNNTITSAINFNLILNVSDTAPSSGFYRTYYEIKDDGSLPPNPTLASPFGTGGSTTIPLTEYFLPSSVSVQNLDPAETQAP